MLFINYLLRFITASLILVSTYSLANVFEPPLSLVEKSPQAIKVGDDSLEIRYAFLYDPALKQDLFHSVRLYDKDNNQLQVIEGEALRKNMFWGQIGSTPIAVDINQDGYLDLMVKVSAGSLGEFYQVWLFNPQTYRYQQTLDEIQEPRVIGKNLITSTSYWRHEPYPVFLSLYHILPDFSFTETSAESVLIPLRKANKGYYCLAIPEANQEGSIHYSLAIELNRNNQITEKSLAAFNALNLGERCYTVLSDLGYQFPTHKHALPSIGLPIWQLTQYKLVTVDPKWTKTATQFEDNTGKSVHAMNCPVIPYIDLDAKKLEHLPLPAFEQQSAENISEDSGYPAICTPIDER
ncbi:hypothetical protein VQ643_07615 [Pseudomonas sp. F1_0610]|uniref:FG-GAP repeat protein n=1 Tax=Pseudomonas sp. F1_0610 TaxID=3114284 RepID=UPI0039C3F621